MEDDDDFDDFDDEDDAPKKQVVPPLAGLLCGMQEKINSYLSEKAELFVVDTIVNKVIAEYSGMARRNTWYTFMETDYSFLLLCGGIQIKQPVPSIEDGRFVLKTEISDDLLRIDEFCDSDINELSKLHPDLILKNHREEFMRRIEKSRKL